jgi:uncharacterized protein YbjT (DUF2867 family)
MNVTVFGATGSIGSQVVDELRSRGHAVTAYVRNPAKVPAAWGKDVAVAWTTRGPSSSLRRDLAARHAGGRLLPEP